MNVDYRLQKFFIECIDALRSNGVVALDNELKEELIAVKINCSAADLPPEDRNVIGLTEPQIHFLVHILMKSDANIRGGR